jgi:hypothetical protein
MRHFPLIPAKKTKNNVTQPFHFPVQVQMSKTNQAVWASFCNHSATTYQMKFDRCGITCPVVNGTGILG